jgi:hypothetical protein
MMPFVDSFTTIGFRKPDLSIFNTIDGTDMNAVGADNFHMLLDTMVTHSALHAV